MKRLLDSFENGSVFNNQRNNRSGSFITACGRHDSSCLRGPKEETKTAGGP